MEDLKKIQAEMEQMRKRLSTYEANYENKEKIKIQMLLPLLFLLQIIQWKSKEKI